MKFLKVTSIGEYGEHTIDHYIGDYPATDALIVATLQGVINAGHAIKSFELQEA